MASERIQRRIDRLLDQIKEAVDQLDWVTVRDRVSGPELSLITQECISVFGLTGSKPLEPQARDRFQKVPNPGPYIDIAGSSTGSEISSEYGYGERFSRAGKGTRKGSRSQTLRPRAAAIVSELWEMMVPGNMEPDP